MRFYSKKIDDEIYGHFDSKTEFDYYKVLLQLQENGEIKNLTRQVEHELLPSFKDGQGNSIRKMTYTSDFEYIDVVSNKLIIVDCKGSDKCIDEKFKVKFKLLKYQQKDDCNIKHSIIIKYKGQWFDIENKSDKKVYRQLYNEEKKKKAERKAKKPNKKY